MYASAVINATVEIHAHTPCRKKGTHCNGKVVATKIVNVSPQPPSIQELQDAFQLGIVHQKNERLTPAISLVGTCDKCGTNAQFNVVLTFQSSVGMSQPLPDSKGNETA